MASTCQIYDETNAVVLFDLNDPTAANVADNGYSSTQLLQDVDLGEPAHEFSRFMAPGTDGGTTVNSRAGFRQVTLPVRIRATSYDNLTTAVGKLSTYLRNGCVIRWQANTSANVRYIDVEPSPAPYVLDGRELSMYLATSLIDTPEGLDLVLTAQPYLRGAEMDSASNLLTNATLLRDADLGGRPDGWSWSSSVNITNEAISATAEAFQFDIATTAQRQLLQVTPNSTVVAAETWCMSGYARVTSSTFTNVEVQAMIEYQTNAGAAVNTITGTLTAIGTGWTRVQCSGVASATSTKAQAGLRLDPTTATSATVQLRNVQFEKQPAATPFHVGSETGIVDPAPTSGMGRLFPFYNPGDAPAPVKVRFGDTTTSISAAFVGVNSNRAAIPGASYLPEFMNRAHLFQAEAFTPGVSTATSVQAAASPGSGTSALLTTYGTTTMSSRGTYSITNTNTLNALRGKTFLVILRWAGSGANLVSDYTITFRWGQGSSGTTVGNTNYAVNVGTYTEDYPGVVTFGNDLPDSATIDLQYSRVSGAGNTIVDFVLLIPCEPQANYIAISPSSLTTTRSFQTDPEHSRITVVNNTTWTQHADSIQTSNGPILFWAPPGLSLFYVHLATSITTLRADVQAVSFVSAPRWSG